MFFIQSKQQNKNNLLKFKRWKFLIFTDLIENLKLKLIGFFSFDQESESNVGCSLNLRRNDLLLMPLPMFELIHLVRFYCLNNNTFYN